MTSFIRRVAGGLAVLESAWLLYAYYDAPTTSCLYPCQSVAFIPVYSWVAAVLAIALVVVGVMAVWGASFSYVAGAVLSAAALAVTGSTVALVYGHGYVSTVSDDAIIGIAFALAALLANIGAMRSKSSISEQANPMNMPVFG